MQPESPDGTFKGNEHAASRRSVNGEKCCAACSRKSMGLGGECTGCVRVDFCVTTVSTYIPDYDYVFGGNEGDH